MTGTSTPSPRVFHAALALAQMNLKAWNKSRESFRRNMYRIIGRNALPLIVVLSVLSLSLLTPKEYEHANHA